MSLTVWRRAEIAALVLALIGDAITTYAERHWFYATRYEISLAIALTGAIALILPGPQRRLTPGLCIALVALPAIAMFNPRLGLTGLAIATVSIVRFTFAFGLRGAAVAGFSAFVALTIGIWMQMPTPRAWIGVLSILLIFGTLYGFIGLLVNTLRSEQSARRELEEAHVQMRTYAERSAELATIEERSRVALDLHDALGHGLTTLSVQLQSANKLRESDIVKADEFVMLANATATSLLSDLRETVAIMRSAPHAVDRFSDRIKRLFSDFAQSKVLACTWRVHIESEPDAATGLLLLRFAQEALTNVARHSAAQHLEATVSGNREQIVIRIADDGRGFRVDDARTGTGLTSMRERLASAGGSVHIDSSDGGGTTVTAAVPLEHE